MRPSGPDGKEWMTSAAQLAGKPKSFRIDCRAMGSRASEMV